MQTNPITITAAAIVAQLRRDKQRLHASVQGGAYTCTVHGTHVVTRDKSLERAVLTALHRANRKPTLV